MNPIKDVIDMIATDALEEQEPRDRYEVALDIIQEQTAENTLLRSRLTVAEETLQKLEAIEHEQEFAGELLVRKSEIATIAREGLKRMEEVK